MVGYYQETLKVPSQCNKSLRKIVNNCLLYDQERRPTFEHVVSYLEHIESQSGKTEEVPPQMMNKLFDFLH